MEVSRMQFKISNLLGNSVNNINLISYGHNCIIYVCGSYIVFYNPIYDQQVTYIQYHNSKISCLVVSPNNNYLAIGEEGKNPSITIYQLNDIENSPPKLLYELKGQKYSISELIYSPNNKYLVSVSNKDGSMFIWEGQERVSQNKLAKSINKGIFDKEGDFISIGKGYLKLWEFNRGQIFRKYIDGCWIIQGKLINFGKKFSIKQFIDLGIYQDKILCLSSDGLLCIILKRQQKIQKWIDLMINKTTSIQIYQEIALCSGDNSIVKAININSLTLQAKFPKPPPFGKENITKDQEELPYDQSQIFPECLGIRKVGQFLLTLYSNKTIFIWNWKIDQNIKAIRSIISHQQKITSVGVLEQLKQDLTFFSTVSQDNTIRIWHIYNKYNRQSIDIADIIGIKRNAYCRNLTRIIYTYSQRPITKICNYLQKYIICIAQEQLFMYSLELFQLMVQEILPSLAVSLDSYQNYVYVGYTNQMVGIYTITNGFIKINQINLDIPIFNLRVIDNNTIVISDNKVLKIYSLSNNQIISTKKNILTYTIYQHHIIYCTQNKVSAWNFNKNKSININLQHQLTQYQQHIIKIKANSWLIVMLTNYYRIIIANFSGLVVHTQIIKQIIHDFQVVENGQIILVGNCGTIAIFKLENNQNYHKVQKRVKKWFEDNDMSWLDGSIWKSQNKINNIKNQYKQDIQGSIDRSLGLPPKKPIPNININYKGQDNRMSVFNPSSIADQANKIYQNINVLMKNQGKRQFNNKYQQKKLSNKFQQKKQSNNQYQQSLKNSDIQFLQLDISKPKKRIFNDQTKKNGQQLLGSLVNSTYHQNKVQIGKQEDTSKFKIDTQQSLRSGYVQMKPISFANLLEGEQPDRLLGQLQYSLHSSLFIQRNSKSLQRIYKILHKHFSSNYPLPQQIIQKYNNLSKQFINFLIKRQQ